MGEIDGGGEEGGESERKEVKDRWGEKEGGGGTRGEEGKGCIEDCCSSFRCIW